MQILFNKLKPYAPFNQRKKIERKETIDAASDLYNNRQEVINAFKTGIFLQADGFRIQEESGENRLKEFMEYIEKGSKGMNYDLFKEYFNFLVPSALAKKLYEIKNKNKNNELVKAIKKKWSDLKDRIKDMGEQEKESVPPDRELKIVEKVLDFNEKNRKQ